MTWRKTKSQLPPYETLLKINMDGGTVINNVRFVNVTDGFLHEFSFQFYALDSVDAWDYMDAAHAAAQQRVDFAAMAQPTQQPGQRPLDLLVDASRHFIFIENTPCPCRDCQKSGKGFVGLVIAGVQPDEAPAITQALIKLLRDNFTPQQVDAKERRCSIKPKGTPK